MKYAVVLTGGKQYKVSEGDVVEVERLTTEAGKDVTFDQVLLFAEDGKVKIGKPNLKDVVITAKVVDHTRGDKLRVAKFKAKARHRRVMGHRQSLTQVEITKIAAK